MVISSCKEADTNVDFFNNASIERDSVNLSLKMREGQEVMTDMGEMNVYFVASELCPQSECASCDVDASIDIFLVHGTDTVKAPTIRIYRCGQDLPIRYCQLSSRGFWGIRV